MNGLPEKQMSEDAPSAGRFIGTSHREIKLTQGKVTMVDAEDFEYLNQWKWHAHNPCKGIYYAQRNMPTPKGKWRYKTIKMHRVILNTPEGLDTDHINRNGLDNRRENLRVATRSENKYNGDLYKNNTSGYKGVNFDVKKNVWVARSGGVGRFIGQFGTLKEAVIARAQHMESMGMIV